MKVLAGGSRRWSVNIAAAILVILWTIPTVGILVTSFRDRDQILDSGWWKAAFTATTTGFVRAGTEAVQEGAHWVETGRVLAARQTLVSWGTGPRAPDAYRPDEIAVLQGGEVLTVAADGRYRLTSPRQPSAGSGIRIFLVTSVPPKFTLDNYVRVIEAEGVGRAFINTLTVTIPATVIPILIAAFAAYALAWIEFPGRALLNAALVGFLVVPLQVALIPLLKLHNEIGLGKGYIGIWLAHTGFGLPLAIYLLRRSMADIPREIIESARIDGATEFHVFRSIVMPLSIPALGSFAIFQFLWVWNDLLVAMVFLGNRPDQLVMTALLREMMGSRGGDWEILAASAFASITVPLVVFLGMQKYLMHGLLIGAAKGGGHLS